MLLIKYHTNWEKKKIQRTLITKRPLPPMGREGVSSVGNYKKLYREGNNGTVRGTVLPQSSHSFFFPFLHFMVCKIYCAYFQNKTNCFEINKYVKKKISPDSNTIQMTNNVSLLPILWQIRRKHNNSTCWDVNNWKETNSLEVTMKTITVPPPPAPLPSVSESPPVPSSLQGKKKKKKKIKALI